MNRVFIFLYGAELEPFRALRPKPQEPIICADSGILLAIKLKYKPKNLVLIGDLDSVPKKLLKWCKENGFGIIKHPENKDFTDGNLALEYACENYSKETEKIVIGGVTNLLDHTMGNILSAVHLIEEGHTIKILSKTQKIYLISKTISINDCKSHTISLIPLKNSYIINTEGLKWKLKNENINMFQSRTLRNIALSNQVKIDISSGVLMVIESW